jgi:hypothetical protein
LFFPSSRVPKRTLLRPCFSLRDVPLNFTGKGPHNHVELRPATSQHPPYIASPSWVTSWATLLSQEHFLQKDTRVDQPCGLAFFHFTGGAQGCTPRTLFHTSWTARHRSMIAATVIMTSKCLHGRQHNHPSYS